MRFETSTQIPATQIAAVEKRLRDAASEAKHPKFFGADEKLEVVVDPKFSSIEELVRRARGAPAPTGDPNLCRIAYEIAKNLCGGDGFCEAAAYAAYLICLRS